MRHQHIMHPSESIFGKKLHKQKLPVQTNPVCQTNTPWCHAKCRRWIGQCVIQAAIVLPTHFPFRAQTCLQGFGFWAAARHHWRLSH